MLTAKLIKKAAENVARTFIFSMNEYVNHTILYKIKNK